MKLLGTLRKSDGHGDENVKTQKIYKKNHDSARALKINTLL